MPLGIVESNRVGKESFFMTYGFPATGIWSSKRDPTKP